MWHQACGETFTPDVFTLRCPLQRNSRYNRSMPKCALRSRRYALTTQPEQRAWQCLIHCLHLRRQRRQQQGMWLATSLHRGRSNVSYRERCSARAWRIDIFTMRACAAVKVISKHTNSAHPSKQEAHPIAKQQAPSDTKKTGPKV